jgi:hypothetical protein
MEKDASSAHLLRKSQALAKQIAKMRSGGTNVNQSRLAQLERDLAGSQQALAYKTNSSGKRLNQHLNRVAKSARAPMIPPGASGQGSSWPWYLAAGAVGVPLLFSGWGSSSSSPNRRGVLTNIRGEPIDGYGMPMTGYGYGAPMNGYGAAPYGYYGR